MDDNIKMLDEFLYKEESYGGPSKKIFFKDYVFLVFNFIRETFENIPEQAYHKFAGM